MAAATCSAGFVVRQPGAVFNGRMPGVAGTRYASRAACLIIVASAALTGCGGAPDASSKAPNPKFSTALTEPEENSAYVDPSQVKFKDDVQTQAPPPQSLIDLPFTDTRDNSVKTVRELSSGKTAVLVMTRGNVDPVCPYCSVQTAELIKGYEAFTARNAEVVLAYPISSSKDSQTYQRMLARSRELLADPQRVVPFPVVLDVNLQNVDLLGIRHKLSKPATYILDPNGGVRFAYVGATLGDRPSIKALLRELDGLSSPEGAAAPPETSAAAPQETSVNAPPETSEDPPPADPNAASQNPAEDAAPPAAAAGEPIP